MSGICPPCDHMIRVWPAFATNLAPDPYHRHGEAVAPSNYNHVILALQAGTRGFRPAYIRPSAALGGVDASFLNSVTVPPFQQRIELADELGVVRLVLGQLDDGEVGGPVSYGLSLRGADGAERLLMSVDDQGPTLVFVRGGNIAIQLGIDDPLLPGDHSGAFITMADDQGSPVLQASVANDGSLQIRSVAVRPFQSP